MKNKKLLIPIFIVAIAAGAYFAYRLVYKPKFFYAGTLEATRIDLPARVATIVSKIDVEEGQHVEKGQQVAQLACEDLRIAGKLASENFARAEKLRQSGSMSQESFDKVSTQKQDSDARLSWCDIASPIAGTVLTKFLEPGEWTSPGVKLLSLANIKDIWAYIYVPQATMSRLKTGSPVKGLIPELGNREFNGIIRKINAEAEFTPKNIQTQAERTRLVFGVKIAFENPDETLKPGMTIEVPLGEVP
jgi:HlyD family secretion protein